jgi:hypothetical protein
MILGEILHARLDGREPPLALELRKSVSDDPRQPRVREEPAHAVEALPARLRTKQRPHVGQRNVPHVDEGEDRCGWREILAHAARHEVADARVGRVDVVEAREGFGGRAEGVGVVYGC